MKSTSCGGLSSAASSASAAWRTSACWAGITQRPWTARDSSYSRGSTASTASARPTTGTPPTTTPSSRPNWPWKTAGAVCRYGVRGKRHASGLKQDCELRGFPSTGQGAQKDFPLLDVCLLLDGLFANSGHPAMQAQPMGVHHHVQGSDLPAVWEEYQALKALAFRRSRQEEQSAVGRTDGSSDIDFDGLVNAFECVKPRRVTPFVWLACGEQGQCGELAGRRSPTMAIENEGSTPRTGAMVGHAIPPTPRR